MVPIFVSYVRGNTDVVVRADLIDTVEVERDGETAVVRYRVNTGFPNDYITVGSALNLQKALLKLFSNE